MNFLLRPFAGYLLLIALAAWFGNRIAESELKPAMRQAVEELLVDVANLLAEVAAAPVAPGTSGEAILADAYGRFAQRVFGADIHGVHKDQAALHVYVTDGAGRVRFDSTGAQVGADFSQWNDVRRTLRGDYGARTTPAGVDDADATMYVAAPLRADGAITGVLSVGKSNLSLEPFFARARASILQAGGAWVAVAVCLALGLSWWLSRDLRRLSQYARDAAAGVRVPAPRFRGGELATLSAALASMRAELEGRAHVEQYAQMLTHELRGPLAALRGAAELLDEDMPERDRRQFVGSIRGQITHMQALIERLLQLAVLENRQALQQRDQLPLRQLVDEAVAGCASQIAARAADVSVGVAAGSEVSGDRLLLRQALQNLLDNALAFSPQGGKVVIVHEREADHDVIRVCDRGSGMPDYAAQRVFERFYSLPRPDSGQKSTGLGLPLVREVAALHGGDVTIANRVGGGVEARLRIRRNANA